MGIRVAYGKKGNIQAAILSGAIPKDSIIFTSDNEETTEIFFYDAYGSLKSATTETGSGVEELKALAEKVAANTAAIESEAEQRANADADIMSLINQLSSNHSTDVDALKSADAALQAELEEKHLTLKNLIDEMGLKVDSVSDRVDAVETTISSLNERVERLEDGGGGGTSAEVIQQINTLETNVTALEEEKLDRSEVSEVGSDDANDIFNDVFGLGSLSMSGDNVTIVGSEVTIENPVIELQTNPFGTKAYWLPGLRVDAPTDRSTGAVYQTMNEATGEWSEIKSFSEYRDGDDYIWLYASATPEKLTFDQRWQFDWDNDGVYEQLITIKVINAQLI